MAINVWAPASGASLMAVKSYDPAATETKSTTNSSLTDADATNLVVTFTAPSSGNVLVRLTGVSDNTGGGSAAAIWGLRVGSSDVTGSDGFAVEGASEFSATRSIYVTGLTPGTSYTYKWAIAANAGTARLLVGGARGAAVMEVWRA